MSLSSKIIAFAIVLALAPLIWSCGSESDFPNPDEMDEIGQELDQRLVQADLKPVEQVDEEIQNIEAE